MKCLFFGVVLWPFSSRLSLGFAFQLFTPLIAEVFPGRLFSCGSFFPPFLLFPTRLAPNSPIYPGNREFLAKKYPPSSQQHPWLFGNILPRLLEYNTVVAMLWEPCRPASAALSLFFGDLLALKVVESVGRSRDARYFAAVWKENRPSHLSYFFSTTVIFVHLIYCW